MAVNYASGLSPFEHKGKCGMTETFDSPAVLAEKLAQLSQWIQQSRHLVVITGAGISTAAGIPDFRGPKGVWTLEQRNEAPQANVTFESAKPTFAHRALVALEEKGMLKYLISQNVDGLHARSGFPVSRLAELHGNMFVEVCPQCRCQYIRSKPVGTMALKQTGNVCTQRKSRGNCRGRLRDTILDWEDALPVDMLELSETHCRQSDLCLCLGTSLQIVPCGNMPLLTKRSGGQIVIVNLQPTKHDKSCHLKINAYIDDVMRNVCDALGITVAPESEPCVRLMSRHVDDNPRHGHIAVDASLVKEECEMNDSKTSTISDEQKDIKHLPDVIRLCRANGDSKLSSVDIKDGDMAIPSPSPHNAKMEPRDADLQNGFSGVEVAARKDKCIADNDIKQEKRNVASLVSASDTIDTTDTVLSNSDFNLKRSAPICEAASNKAMKGIQVAVTTL